MVYFKKHPIVLLYKGYKSSANYDGEPSVSKGIVSQLPSSHLSTAECLLSFQTWPCPTERTTTSYSSCLFFDFTDLPTPQGTNIPWMLTLPRFADYYDVATPVALHHYRVSFQNPA